jgi:hypothetical protein
MLAAEWETSSVNELDISSTELTEHCLLDMFSRMPRLTYLAVPNCDGFTDRVNYRSSSFSFYLFYLFKVLGLLIDDGKLTNIRAIDISNTVNLNFEVVSVLLKRHGRQLRGISYAGNAKITEQFWINTMKYMKNIKSFYSGTFEEDIYLFVFVGFWLLVHRMVGLRK